jgi:hypothetical protein
VYRVAPVVAARLGNQEGAASGITRNRFLTPAQYARFYLWPPKRQAGIEERKIAGFMTALPPDAGLAVKAGNRALALYLQEVRRVRPDLAILSVGPQTVSAALSEQRPVFVIEPGAIAELEKAGFGVEKGEAPGTWRVRSAESRQ